MKLYSLLLFLITALASHAKKPNFVIIFNDDMGYADLGCFGADKIKTPRIDQMAKEGRKFTSFYVASAVCSASRAALLTGCYPMRVGVRGVFFPNRGTHGLEPRHYTIAELLKSAGYKTLAAGKWHLGDEPKFLPTNQGFDTFYGVPYSNDMYPAENMKYAKDCLYLEGMSHETIKKAFADAKPGHQPKLKDKVPLMRDEECIEFPLDQRTITRRIADESIRFIKESVKEKKPFFVYLANPMPHTPLFVSKDFEGKSAGGIYGDVIEEIDYNTGRVLDTLKEQGVDDNTLVIFTSDNGPWLIKGDHGGSAKPLREGKARIHEGGQRVPLMVRWPGRIKAGSTSEEIVAAIDLYPTLLDALDLSQPKGHLIDGESILPVLEGKGSVKRQAYFTWFPHLVGAVSVRQAHYKLIRRFEPHEQFPELVELYDLKKDIGERNNLTDKMPDRVRKLQALIDGFVKETGALYPKPNPTYDPDWEPAAKKPAANRPNPEDFLRKRDKDKDGLLTLKEYIGNPEGRNLPALKKQFGRRDGNADGKLTLAELKN
jgi:arylsulfatase A